MKLLPARHTLLFMSVKLASIPDERCMNNINELH